MLTEDYGRGFETTAVVRFRLWGIQSRTMLCVRVRERDSGERDTICLCVRACERETVCQMGERVWNSTGIEQWI